MKQLFTNGKFILYDKQNDTFSLYEGDMICESNRIYKTNKKYENVDIINLNNKVVMPTLVNAHLHLGETVFRPLPKKMTLLEYIAYTEDYNKAHKENLNEIWLESAKTTLEESKKHGVMAVNTIRGNNILADFDINSLSGYPIMKSEKLKDFIAKGVEGFENFYTDCKNKGIKPGVFLHSFYTNDSVSFDMATKCYNLHPDTFFCTHLAEDNESEEKVVKMWGKRSIQILHESNLLNDSTILIHGNTLNDDELKLMASTHSSLVLCPASANNLKTKLIDIDRLIKHKVNFCIATDGLASGESANLLHQTSLIKNVDSVTLLKAITINPANAMMLDNEILTDGSRCNMIVLEDFEYKDTEDIIHKIVNNKVKINKVYYNGKLINN